MTARLLGFVTFDLHRDALALKSPPMMIGALPIVLINLERLSSLSSTSKTLNLGER